MENEVINPPPETPVETPPVAPPAISIKSDLEQDGADIEKTAEDTYKEVKESL